jgi:hypothetical protein
MPSSDSFAAADRGQVAVVVVTTGGTESPSTVMSAGTTLICVAPANSATVPLTSTYVPGVVVTLPLVWRTNTPSDAVWVARSMLAAPVPGVWM